MKKIILISAATIFLASGCERVEYIDNVEKEPVVKTDYKSFSILLEDPDNIPSYFKINGSIHEISGNLFVYHTKQKVTKEELIEIKGVQGVTGGDGKSVKILSK